VAEQNQEDAPMSKQQKNVISVLLENEAGALARVVGLFAQRGYNIESMTVAPTQDPTLSRLTLTTYAPAMEQISKQLHKIVPVYKVMELSQDTSYLEREILLVKLRALGEYRAELKRLADIFNGKIVDVTASSYTIELTGRSKEIDAFIRNFDNKNILEFARSGITGLARGAKGFTIKSQEE